VPVWSVCLVLPSTVPVGERTCNLPGSETRLTAIWPLVAVKAVTAIGSARLPENAPTKPLTVTGLASCGTEG
jgi:hypothetical protein